MFDGDKVSIADPKAHLESKKQGDEWSIRIDDEFYVVPEIAIIGD